MGQGSWLPRLQAMERITGPVHGFWLASYTVETAQGHFGYAKVCNEQPHSVWDGTPARAKVACGPFTESSTALLLVIDKVETLLDRRARMRGAARR
jgi:hypothetical protein